MSIVPAANLNLKLSTSSEIYLKKICGRLVFIEHTRNE